MNHSELQQALLRSHPQLSRFDPLDRIIFHDDFDEGLNGWTLVAGNYEDSLDTMLEEYKHLRAPTFMYIDSAMLSAAAL